MNPQTWWYLARATGFVAWGLLSLSVISGLLFSTRLTHGRPTAAWLLDLHRFLAGAGVVFTGLHLLGLVADSYTHFGAVALLVPFGSSWKPGAVALGVVALYLLAAIEITSLLMRRLPRRLWRAVHAASFGLFWTTTFHLLLAGTDTANPVAGWIVNVVAATVAFLTLVAVLSPGGPSRRRTPRPPSPRAQGRRARQPATVAGQ